MHPERTAKFGGGLFCLTLSTMGIFATQRFESQPLFTSARRCRSSAASRQQSTNHRTTFCRRHKEWQGRLSSRLLASRAPPIRKESGLQIYKIVDFSLPVHKAGFGQKLRRLGTAKHRLRQKAEPHWVSGSTRRPHRRLSTTKHQTRS